ncbi:cytidylate kinase family protein [Clostridium estertheticum]|uniref:cytidylate kinase family protein n=1 Tax=Clostridium estertheticum TaxID=238834 RepID=UPI000A606AE9|nr:cytidylate kinase family protein [Clostridium estertheticum]MBU3073721.1 cytidylate kinase family protein [Clostridium estertheticum]MBU3163814.1 cytidylate kinase family protein [Clostridium estertheticum]MBU3184214.1 cytidylate kinase family protein [Clostridium estertheticum]MBZ9615889.1 cytidylate kinase family protein [Clostridium estertheticum subsp. laramiense]WAG75758.1 cytidylate kinase family protein [Clostridium estertheticum]
MKLKITITGDLYSGKSSVAKGVCEVMDYTYFSVGELQRRLAVEKGMSIMEYNDYVFQNNLDHEVDNRTMAIGIENENFIFDARLAWYFIPNSFKIYFKVDIDIAVERAMESNRGECENYTCVQEAKERIIGRRRLEVTRFNEIYNIDIDNDSNYDLVIDTSHMTMKAVIEKTIEKLRECSDKK